MATWQLFSVQWGGHAGRKLKSEYQWAGRKKWQLGSDSRSEEVIKRRKDSCKVKWPLKRTICGWMLLEILPSVVLEQKGRWGAGRSSGDGGRALKLGWRKLLTAKGLWPQTDCKLQEHSAEGDPSSHAELGLPRGFNTLLHASRIPWFFFIYFIFN